MTYQRINFKDQVVERPKTYDVTNNPDGSITLIDSFGNVEELGTPINSETMGHIEDALEEHDSRITTLENAADYDNFLNKTQITNCLLEVPQNIKLEIVNGELILKKGSTYIMPNGANNFERVTITEDLKRASFGASTRDDMFIQIFRSNSSGLDGLSFVGPEVVVCSTEQPETGKMWYDLTNNKIYNVNSTGLENALRSFPFAIVRLENGVPVEIKQVFNGFGYFGSSYFADIGIKFLSPYGINSDGTLKNREFTSTAIRVSDVANTTRTNQALVIAPNYFGPQAAYRYDNVNNYNYRSASGSEGIQQTALVGRTSVENNSVTQFEIFKPFRAVDYNDFKEVKTIQDNTKRYVVEKSDKSLLPSWYTVYSDGWKEQGTNFSIISNSTTITFLKPFQSNPTLAFTNIGYNMYRLSNITNISFTIVDANYNSGDKSCSWYACGY